MTASGWQRAQVRMYDMDGMTERTGSPIAAKGLGWTDEFKGEGSASLTQLFIDTAYVANPDILRAGIGKIEVQLEEDGDYEAVFGFVTTPGTVTLVGPAQDGDKGEALTCRGLRAILDDWVVLHDGGFSRFAGDERSFGFMSIDYDDSGWSVPEEQPWFGDPNPSRAGYPEVIGQILGMVLGERVKWIGLEDPSEALLADGAVNYFRNQFDNPEQRRLRFYVVGDNYVDYYINGEPIYLANEAQDAYGWKDVQSPPYERIFAAGTITQAAKVTNAALTSGANPVALLVVVTTLDANGNPDQVVAAGTTGNTVSPWVVTDEVTGLTAAQILLRLMAEAEDDRDNVTQGYVTATFDEAQDTNETPWPDLQERAFEIGTKGGQVVEDLESVAFDLDLRPDMTLNAYVDQGNDVSATVGIADAGLEAYSAGGQPMVGTRLLLRINDRWLYLIDTSAEAAGSLPREAFIEAGLSLSTDQGTNVGDANLADMARETFTYTATFVAQPGFVPYDNFGKGDIIAALNHKGEAADLQVVSISGDAPDDGIVRWTIEMREP